MLGIVGESECGKSTVLMQLYVPNEGTITWNGQNENDLSNTWIHDNISYVTQEPVLFSGTIRENLMDALGARRVKWWKRRTVSFGPSRRATTRLSASLERPFRVDESNALRFPVRSCVIRMSRFLTRRRVRWIVRIRRSS